MTDPNRTEPAGFEPFEPATPSNMAKDPTQRPGWERATLEKLAFASLNEQKATRRWKTFVRLSWLAFFIFLAWLALSRSAPSTAKTTAHTAVVEIKGEIANGGDASAEFVVAAMKTAFEDEGAKGVILLINSPGGSPVQAGIINDEIKRLKAKYKKPIYAVVEETCASAAYYIAAATDKIYVDKASIVGSIGVLMDGFGFTGVMEKVGVERRLLTAGENKGFLDPFSPMSDAQRAHAQTMLNQIHAQFINVVKTGRGDRLKLDTPGLFSGLFWSGEQAVEYGLADQLGNVDYVAREVIKADEVIDYTRRDNVAEKLAKKFGASMAETTVRLMHTAPALR
ncbi:MULTISPECIES: S49 family peptidase [Variovorax]|jgi:protease IV|uniref:S49 family peptidase n=1 Tax=Variovorax TaxID=34072 RepID=UPI000869B52A|nr:MULTISPECIES: S49 family peptidase [Variovorax]MBN8757043.1 S49 family peptidase [Variovorax sp.]ODU13831.1 MAG: peptidase S49 [Variovorax sp. SCN 67-85]ODV21107.1 MAG: peptidase S49 [Variovorax sp. SCN 67-20]OJZ08423.1 MAG: S49 family peptidase [Variovorax sp. 67-131]UKI10214.1 S49 family peptidase [Variovorax paradoxus]